MSRVGVSLRLDVTKIDKARLFRGQKGTYLDATVFIDLDELDQYGNSGMITQDVTKEEKQNGTKGNILGNCKVFWSDTGGQPSTSGQQQRPPQQQGGFGQPSGQPAPRPNQGQQGGGFQDFDDDIPFN